MAQCRQPARGTRLAEEADGEVVPEVQRLGCGRRRLQLPHHRVVVPETSPRHPSQTMSRCPALSVLQQCHGVLAAPRRFDAWCCHWQLPQCDTLAPAFLAAPSMSNLQCIPCCLKSRLMTLVGIHNTTHSYTASKDHASHKPGLTLMHIHIWW